MTSHDPVTDPRAFWADVAGVDPDQLVFPPGPAPFTRRWTNWLQRHPRMRNPGTRALHLWRILWFGTHHPEPALLPLTPLNLAPWTNRLLPHQSTATDTTLLQRGRDRILWSLSHPATRFETHAWRCRAHRDTPLIWRLQALRNTLAGRPSGPPPWLNVPGPAIADPPVRHSEVSERPTS